MNPFFFLMGALGLIYYTHRAKGKQPETTLIGTEPKRVYRGWGPAEQWKRDLPICYNHFGGRPYGWSGHPAQSYLIPQPVEAPIIATGGGDPFPFVGTVIDHSGPPDQFPQYHQPQAMP